MLALHKKHIVGSIKKVGYGTYSEVFKIFYDLCEDKDCTLCPIYKKAGFYTLKEILFTPKFDNEDFSFEIAHLERAYQVLPDLVIPYLHSWTEVFVEDKNLGQAPLFNREYGYIALDYMNYRDLYFNYVTTKQRDKWARPIYIPGVFFICLVILYALHKDLNLCHGDFRDTNIFLNYMNPNYKQKVYIQTPRIKREIDVYTGGFHVRLGDFGLAEPIQSNRGGFLFRDYEFIENIYKNKEKWAWMVREKEADKLLNFIEINFLPVINQTIKLYATDPSQKKARADFWFDKHVVAANSIFLYKMPESLIESYIDSFYTFDEVTVAL